MTKFSAEYFDRVTVCVDEAETKTSVELVVAILPQSGVYRDVDLLFGALVAWTGLLFIVFNPWTVHSPAMLPFETAALFLVGVLCSALIPWLRRLLTTKQRREAQVREAAANAFVTDGVANTRDRTGVLLFLSRLERRLDVIADVGITKSIPPEVWSDCLFELRQIAVADDPAQSLIDGIHRLGEVCAQFLPPREDNPDEIPNRPRTSR